MSVAAKTGSRSRRWIDGVFEVVWLLLGLAAVGDGVLHLYGGADLLPGPRNSYVITLVFGAMAISTAITDVMSRRSWRVVGAVTGAVLGLYGAAMIFLGHEDVGGLWVALPFGLLSIALGSWSVSRFLRAPKAAA